MTTVPGLQPSTDTCWLYGLQQVPLPPYFLCTKWGDVDEDPELSVLSVANITMALVLLKFKGQITMATVSYLISAG